MTFSEKLLELRKKKGLSQEDVAEEIKIAATEDVKFIVSSDAHSANRVGSFEGGIKRALEAGLDIDRIVNIEVK